MYRNSGEDLGEDMVERGDPGCGVVKLSCFRASELEIVGVARWGSSVHPFIIIETFSQK